MNIGSLLKNKEVKNAGWLIGFKIIQMVITLLVSIFTARFLGPGNYGLVNYGAAYVSFFSSICTLGLNSVLVKDFVDHPDEQGTTIGSALLMRFISGLLSIVTIVSLSYIMDKGEPTTVLVVALCSVGIIFQVFDTFDYWFQSQYKSKVTAISAFIAYIILSAYRLFLLLRGESVIWFALASSVDYFMLSAAWFIAYKVYKGPKLKFSLKKCKELLKLSYHYILPGLMVSIYSQTDKMMLKQLVGQTEVGYYATAMAICVSWVYILRAIIDSVTPTILKLKKDGETVEYERRNRQLYAMVFWIACAVSIIFFFAGNFAIPLLYGSSYAPAATVLKVVSWYTAFSYLNVARNIWIVSENKQKYLTGLYLGAAITNVILNLILIPTYGAMGAGIASLIAQVMSGFILPFCIKPLRPNAILMLQGILFIKVRKKKVAEKDLVDCDSEKQEKRESFLIVCDGCGSPYESKDKISECPYCKRKNVAKE